MKKVLLTGFDPFNGEKINPAYESAILVADQIGDFCIYKLEVPTLYNQASKVIIRKIEEIHPDVVLMLGQAGGRDSISLEKVAINYRNATIGDNHGVIYLGEQIDSNCENAIFTNIDIETILKQLKQDNYNVKISLSAGGFICNETFFNVGNYCLKNNMKFEFIHVPYLPSQAKENLPSMELDEMVKTISRFIELCG